MPQTNLRVFLLLLIAVLLGGGGTTIASLALPIDAQLIQVTGAWRRTHPDAAHLLVWLTQLGGAPVTIGLAAIACLLTAGRAKADAVLLAATVLGGRLMIEIIKWLVDRPRPAYDIYPVNVFSQSFPSAHAGNSMITYLAIALVALPRRWRGVGTVGAVLLSLAIGTTRPVLGVHWPSDVLAGWGFGIAWVLLCLALGRRFRTS